MDFLSEEKNIIKKESALEVVFVTLGLEGSLAEQSIELLQNEYDADLAKVHAAHGDSCTIRRLKKVYFAKMDSLLDDMSRSPQWLKENEVAKLAVDKLQNAPEGVNAISYTILPNHVHLLLEAEPDKIEPFIADLKKELAAKINETTGGSRQVWIDASHSYKIFDQKELINVVSYILENPVKAGLAPYWKDWPWSFCNPEYI